MEKKSSASQNLDKSSLCEECGKNPSKYRCPGCSIRTCSLPCVKSHKQRTSCTGKRPRTDFVPLSEFNDNIFISDYNFLEETKRMAVSAKRMRDALCGNYGFRTSFTVKVLLGAARQRKMKVLFLPSGMSRREKNQSRYDKKRKSISWTIEWRFHSTDVVLTDHGVDENKSLKSIIEEHLKPGPWNHKLRPFCNEQLDSLKFFIRKIPEGPKSPFRELNIEASLRQQFSGIVVVEYPVIHVLLPSHSCDFKIERLANAFPKERESGKSVNDSPSPKGVFFREEEPEDDMPSDTQFLELMTYMNSEQYGNFQMIEKDVILSNTKASERTQLVRNNEGCACHLDEVGEYSHSNTKEFGVIDDMAFDFEQDLQDAYSHLIGQANPDDYLCLEDGFIEDMEGTGGDRSVIDELFSVGEALEKGEIMGEELEEGEIVEF